MKNKPTNEDNQAVKSGLKAQKIVKDLIEEKEIKLSEDQIKALKHRIRDELIAQDHRTRNDIYVDLASIPNANSSLNKSEGVLDDQVIFLVTKSGRL